MNETRVAALLVVAGVTLAALGLAVVYPPAGIIAAGLFLALAGIDARRRP